MRPLIIAKVSSRGRIVLPAVLRRQDGIKAGHAFGVKRLSRGNYRFTRRPALQNEGVIDWLLACPVKGFFVPIEPEPGRLRRERRHPAGTGA